jgi:hypothetical protein
MAAAAKDRALVAVESFACEVDRREWMVQAGIARHRPIYCEALTRSRDCNRRAKSSATCATEESLARATRITSSQNSLGNAFGTVNILPAETPISTDQMSPTRAADPDLGLFEERSGAVQSVFPLWML